MQPAKRKLEIETIPAIQQSSNSPTQLNLIEQASKAAKGLFDVSEFIEKFNACDSEEAYRLIRTLAYSDVPLPLNDLELIVRSKFKHLNLQAFLVDFKSNQALACAKHFGQLSKLEQKRVSEEITDKIMKAANGYQPDSKFIANLMGDHFIGMTQLEGFDLKTSSENFLSTFSILRDVYGISHPKIEEQLKELNQWAVKLHAIDGKSKAEVAVIAQEILDVLGTKGEVLLPGGYKSLTGGHALLYHIVKKNGKCSFTIYNSGEGINLFHKKKIVNNKEVYNPVFCAKNITEDKLTLNFLTTLFGYCTLAIEVNARPRSTKGIYNLIIDGLNVTQLEDVASSAFITPQRSGTCPISVILAFLSTNLTLDQYKRLKQFIREIHVALMPKNDLVVEAIHEDIIANLYRGLDKRYENKQINFKEFFRFFSLISHNTKCLLADKQVDFFPIEKYPAKFVAKKTKLVRDDGDTLLEHFEENLGVLPLISPFKQANELIPKLKDYIQVLKEFSSKNQRKETAAYYTEIVNALPLIEDSIWEGLSLDEVDEFSELLKELCTILIFSKMPETSDHIVHRIYFYALALRLARNYLQKKFSNDDLAKLFHPYPKELNAFQSVSGKISMTNQSKFNSVKNYFNKTFDQNLVWRAIVGDNVGGLFLGPDYPAVKFVNSYFIAVKRESEIPVQYDRGFYINILLGAHDFPKILKAPCGPLYDMLYNDFKDKVIYDKLGNYKYDRNFEIIFKISKDNAILRSKLKELFTPSDTNPINSVIIHLLLGKLLKKPNQLQSEKFRAKFSKAFLESHSGISLFQSEIKTKDGQRFLNRLRKILREQIELTLRLNDVDRFVFLLQFILDLQQQLEVTLPDSTFRLDQTVEENDIRAIFDKTTSSKIYLSIQAVRWHENYQLFNGNWTVYAVHARNYGADDQTLIYHKNQLRYRLKELSEGYTNLPIDQKRLLFQLVGCSESHIADFTWPEIKTKSGHSFDLLTPKMKLKDNNYMVLKASSTATKAIKLTFAVATPLIRKKPNVIEGVGIYVTKEFPGYPVVTRDKLFGLYKIKINPSHPKGNFAYLKDRFAFLAPLFYTDRFDPWMSMDKSGTHKWGYIIDNKTLRCLKFDYHTDSQEISYEDIDNDLQLIDHSDNNCSFSQFLPYFKRFDHEESFFVWQSKNTDLDLVVEFPSYDLIFDVSSKKKKIFCRHFPGFYLAHDQISWARAKHGITLKNDLNERIFLLADKNYTSLPANAPFTSDAEGKGVEDNKYIVLKILPQSKLHGHLTFEATDLERLIFVNYLCSAGHFKEAVYQVKMLFKQNGEKEVFERLGKIIFSFENNYFKCHPDYVAFRLHLVFLYLSMAAGKPIEVVNTTSEDILNYATNVNNVSHECKLDMEQMSALEAVLISYSNSSSMIRKGTLWDMHHKFLSEGKIVNSTAYALSDAGTSSVFVMFETPPADDLEQEKKGDLASIYNEPAILGKIKFWGLFKTLCVGIVNQQSADVEEVLYRAVYGKINDPVHNKYYCALIELANQHRDLIIKVVTPAKIAAASTVTDWEKIAKSIIHEILHPPKKSKKKRILPNTEPKQPYLETTTQHVSQKREIQALAVPAKHVKLSKAVASPISLFAKYFTKEIDHYKPYQISFNNLCLEGVVLTDKINQDLRENQAVKSYVLKDANQFPELITELTELLLNYKSDLQSCDVALHQLTNTPYVDNEEALVVELRKIAKVNGEIRAKETVKVLLDRYVMSDQEPFETPELEQAVFDWVNTYLNLAVMRAAVKEVVIKLRKTLDVDATGSYEQIIRQIDRYHLEPDAPGIEQFVIDWINSVTNTKFIQHIANETDVNAIGVLLKRAQRDQDLLSRVTRFYEIVSNKLLRKKQWKLLCAIRKDPRQVYQIPSGEGKTDVYTKVLIQTELATRSVFNIVPLANIETNYEELRTYFLQHTVHRVNLLSFRRSDSDSALIKIHSSIISAIQKKTVFVTDSVTLQALLLTYFEKVLESKPDNYLGLLQEIIKFIMNQSAIVDEEHLVFSVLNYLNYASKQEKPLERYRWITSQKLVDLMLEYNRTSKDQLFPIGQWHHLNDFSHDKYENTLKPILIKLVHQLFPQLNSDELSQYLLCNRLLSPEQERLKSLRWFKKQPTSVRTELQLVKAHVNSYIPHALAGRCYVTFGPHKDSEVAGPYLGNMKQVKGSSFQNSDVMLALTYFMYHISGLSNAQVKKMAEGWKHREQSLNQPNPFNSQHYLSTLLDKDLNQPGVIENIAKIIKFDSVAINEYLDLIICPDVRVQTHRFVSSAYDLSHVLLPKRMIGFTATLLSNFATLPKDIKINFDGKVSAELIALLHNPAHTEILLQDKLDLTACLNLPDVCVVLDPHAFMEGKTNRIVAEALLNASPVFSKCQYYDDESNMMTTLVRPQDNQKTLTYFDQVHTTGVNTIQPANGVGLMLINKGLTYTELLQAAKRLRGFGKGQKIVFVVTHQVRDLILESMGTAKLTNESIVLWSVLNEVAEFKKIISVCFDQYLLSIYRSALLPQLLNQDDSSKRYALSLEYKEMLIESVENDEFKELASLEKPKTALEAFLDKFERYKCKYSPLLNAETEEELRSLEQMAKTYLSKCQETDQTESLGLTAHKEQQQQIYKETHEQLTKQINIKKIETWTLEVFAANHLYNQRLLATSGDRISGFSGGPTAIPMSYVVSQFALPGNLFVTKNFVGHKVTAKIHAKQFEKIFPKVNFILDILFEKNIHTYFLVADEEANHIRESCNRITDLTTITVHLYQGDGYRVSGTAAENPELDSTVLAICKFLNGDTQYNGELKDRLRSWLKEDNKAMKNKIARFVNRARHNEIVYLRNLQGTDVQTVFDSVA